MSGLCPFNARSPDCLRATLPGTEAGRLLQMLLIMRRISRTLCKHCYRRGGCCAQPRQSLDGTYSCAYFIRCTYYVKQTRNQRTVVVVLVVVVCVIVIVWLAFHKGRGL